MSTQHAQYVLQFLVLAVNSTQFQILESYTLLLQPVVLVCFCCGGGLGTRQIEWCIGLRTTSLFTYCTLSTLFLQHYY